MTEENKSKNKSKRLFFIEDISPNKPLIKLHHCDRFGFVTCDSNKGYCPLCEVSGDKFSNESTKVGNSKAFRQTLVYDYEDGKVKSILLTHYLYNKILEKINEVKEISDIWTTQKRDEGRRYKYLRKSSLTSYVDFEIKRELKNGKTEYNINIFLENENKNRTICTYLEDNEEFNLSSYLHLNLNEKVRFDKSKEIVISKLFGKTQYTNDLVKYRKEEIQKEKLKESFNDLSDIFI